MDACGPLKIYDGPKRHPLTPARMSRGVVCLVVILSTAIMMLVGIGFVTAVLMRFFSIHYSRKATSIFFGIWLALWPFLFEKINKTKVVLAGESVPSNERVLLIANHRTEVDWMYLWDLALRKGQLGNIRYVLKKSLMKLPVFGWAFHIMEFISVERKWEVDELPMRQMLSTFKNRRDPLWLAVFPEGTDFTEQKCIRSQKYASEKGLPIMKNVLLPKSKGFCACLEELRDSMDAVYDITIGYKYRCPTFLDNAFGVDPSEVHMHVRRIPLNDIPASEDEASSWLIDAFHLKDQLLSDFYSRGHFPHEGTENDLSTTKCLVNFLFVIILTSVLTYAAFSYVLFRIYFLLVCAYMASATHLNFRPSPFFNL
ncbi:putative 1-acyl-sn-glycerol-3-phosphate acyltransferase 5 [Apium graveolens]|uniref:putative 1-acyl-sn-glycerol-3-phosphate acyltransferase 5 n=1 Tax=Apium graveolens TaxID=4045 RepID=UPI003D78C85E